MYLYQILFFFICDQINSYQPSLVLSLGFPTSKKKFL